MKQYFNVTSHPQTKNIRALEKGLEDYNYATSPSKYEELGVFVYDDKHKLIGGAYGSSEWDWINIDYLWVSPKNRMKGLGTKILKLIEKECKKRKCKGIYLNTYSFQAINFYKKYGFTIIGTITNYPKNGAKYFLIKMV